MPSRAARRSSTFRSSVAPDDISYQSLNEDTTMPGGYEANEKGDSTLADDDPKRALATRFLATMMREVIIDTALFAHRSVERQERAQGNAPRACPVCRKSCQAQASVSNTVDNDSSATENDGGVTVPAESNVHAIANAAPQPKGLDIYHNNPLLACLVCSRQVSANRYAQHLASCVGVGKGGLARRKGKMMGNAKVKTALENRKRAGFLVSGASTPIQRASDDAPIGTSDDEAGRRRTNLIASSSALNENGKRSASPTESHEPNVQ